MKTNEKQSKMMEEKGYITVAAAAEKLGMTSVGVTSWMDVGQGGKKVAGMRIGKRRFVSLASLREFLGPEASEAFDLGEMKPVPAKAKRRRNDQ